MKPSSSLTLTLSSLSLSYAQAQANEVQKLNAAIDAAALASAVGDQNSLDVMMAQAQQAAPLDPEMEAVLASLPEAARIAARASAVAGKMGGGGGDANGESKNGGGGGGGGGAAKEPTLAELLKAQSISLKDDDDPALEDMREFFETVDDVAKAEAELDRANQRNAAMAGASAAAATAALASSSKAKQLDDSAIEWEGEWKNYS